MGLPSVGKALSGLLASPDPQPKPRANLSGLSIFWQDTSGATVSVRFDAVTTETYEAIMQVTDHPVEVGANVVDNARELPSTFVVDGYVSNKQLGSNPGQGGVLVEQVIPLTIPKPDPHLSLASLTGAAFDALLPPPQPTATVQTTDTTPSRVAEMLEALDSARVGRFLCTISCAPFGLDIDSLLIRRRAVSRTLADGTGATFHVELTKIRLVSALTVGAPQPAEARGMKIAAKGSKATKEASEGQKKKASLAYQLHHGATK